MEKGIKKATKVILAVLALLVMFLIGHGYKGPLITEENSYIPLGDLIPALLSLIFIWICYKVYELNKRVGNIENKQEELKKKIV